MSSEFTDHDKSTIRKKFGLIIRQKRHALDISIEELAFRSGLHHNYVGSVERGERNIALENIIALSLALGCSPSELLPDCILNFKDPSKT